MKQRAIGRCIVPEDLLPCSRCAYLRDGGAEDGGSGAGRRSRCRLERYRYRCRCEHSAGLCHLYGIIARLRHFDRSCGGPVAPEVAVARCGHKCNSGSRCAFQPVRREDARAPTAVVRPLLRDRERYRGPVVPVVLFHEHVGGIHLGHDPVITVAQVGHDVDPHHVQVLTVDVRTAHGDALDVGPAIVSAGKGDVIELVGKYGSLAVLMLRSAMPVVGLAAAIVHEAETDLGARGHHRPVQRVRFPGLLQAQCHRGPIVHMVM